MGVPMTRALLFGVAPVGMCQIILGFDSRCHVMTFGSTDVYTS